MKVTGNTIATLLLGLIVISFGWGYEVDHHLTRIDDKIGYLDAFLKKQYPGRFISTDLETLERQVSPLVQASEGTKPTVGTLVWQKKFDFNDFVFWDPKTRATETVELAPNAEWYAYLPATKSFRRIPASSLPLPPGTAVATLKAKAGDRVDKIYTTTWEPQKSSSTPWSWSFGTIPSEQEPEWKGAATGPTTLPSPSP